MSDKMNIRQYAKMAAQNIYLPLVYGLYRHRKIRPRTVLFADAHHDGLPDNMRELRSSLKKDGWQITEMYLDYRKASAGRTMKAMTAFMKQYAVSQAVVICDNFLPVAGCRKRKETKVVQLWHACGSLKKFGYATTDDIPSGYKGNVFRNIDLVTVSAPACIEPFSRAMRLPEENIRALGVSRTDRYFDPKWRKRAAAHFLERYPDAADRKVAVWAPTFRGSPGDPQGIDLDVELLQKELGEDWLVITKQHPHMEKEKTLPIEELFVAADVLIADYSSLIYEYLLFGKPLVLYVPDYESYCADRGFFMPHEEIPGVRVFAEKELADAVRQAGSRSPEEKAADDAARRAFLEKWMSACDGHSTQRIAGYLEGI